MTVPAYHIPVAGPAHLPEGVRDDGVREEEGGGEEASGIIRI